ncbi:hypothetical protein MKX03_032274 [Papaver bracteatum]|nr:hypothetical protein MKX03_032274 [Papaver bracteatum]
MLIAELSMHFTKATKGLDTADTWLRTANALALEFKGKAKMVAIIPRPTRTFAFLHKQLFPALSFSL